MEFRSFKEALANNFNEMCKDVTHLFEVEVDKDEMWNLYLDSFPEGTNIIYRQRREYDCSCCRQFIKSIGNAVVIKNNEVTTVWDFDAGNDKIQQVADALATYIKSKTVSNVYVSKFKKVGTDYNFEQMEDGSPKRWEHFFLELDDKFIDRSSRSEGDIKGTYRDTRNVFKRSLDEITTDSIEIVLELIAQNSLYKGEEWKVVLFDFLKYKNEYEGLNTDQDRENYAWERSVKVGGSIGRIRNHSIGTLLVNISEGMDLDTAVKKYEVIVAPANYKRPKAIFTKKMLEDAKKTITELGYMNSLARRHAKLDDIAVNNILFTNKDAAKRIGGDVFAEMAGEVTLNPKHFSKVEEVAAETFVNDILPTARELEIMLENRHASSMVSLIAPVNKESPSMFKWNNGFSWAYSGNMTDSSMKERVKAAGGNVEGVLRFSIQWNDNKYNPNDFDAHCIESTGNHIYYGNTINRRTGGNLDVDIRHPRKDTAAVENITWADISRMADGTYKFFVHNYAHRGGRTGFSAEIEFEGQIYSFEYGKELKSGENIQVAEVRLIDGVFSIKEKLPSSVSTKMVWELQTNQFVPVSVVMHSPNYWDEQQGIGHKHYFFMLKDCINPENPNGFYNEFLKQELVEHKRVFEALGGKMAVADVDDQLSGLGFSATKRNDVVLKVKGQTERTIKVKF